MKKILTSICAILLFTTTAYAGWNPNKSSNDLSALKQEAAITIKAFKDKDPSLHVFFDKAYGYAVFPTIGKGGFLIGGAYGTGLVYQQDKLIGATKLTQVSVGLQAGGQAYSEIIFFKNQHALNNFKNGNFKLGAQISAVVATTGAAANADYSDGVAIFTLPKGGLMGEASVGGQKFSFIPVK